MHGRGAGASIALGLTVVALVPVLLSGCAASPTAALSRMAHLDRGTPVSGHIVPPVVPDVDADLVDSSVRLLAEQDGTAFWVGATSADDICFIAAPAPADLLATPSPTPSPAGAGTAAPGATPTPSASAAASAAASTPAAVSQGFGPPTTAAPTLPVPSLSVSQPEAVCLSPDSFGSHGATLRLGAEGTRVWLHTEYMTVGTGWVPIAQNIAVKA
ncbi:hypothetical protein [Herbiconiux flava]|uniref:Uncharacterized protein n=1 Tax=Herbiconiux flava TaxID=881268 RepID=A0A852SS51_9MICO|nr:hypothetical protein [Herbiconiux flava]NYD71726.1 hypothetical protein [Herbiconiux flava]GLK18310.1 hypothetical protein GCM10017602_27920 [Herbiconiux flava]